MKIFLDKETEFVFLYIARHWNCEFNDIDGYKLIQDIINILGYDEDNAKSFVRNYFSEFIIVDEWFNKKSLFAPWLKQLWSPGVYTREVDWSERRLNNNVSREMLQDMQRFHNINVEDEFSRMLTDELNLEICRNLATLGDLNHNDRRYIMGVDVANPIDLTVSQAVLDHQNNMEYLNDTLYNSLRIPKQFFNE